MEAAISQNKNHRDLNSEIQEEILKYFNDSRQNYILTPDEIVINYDEFILNSILNEHEKLAPKPDEIKGARLIEHIANIFSKIKNMNASESTKQSWTRSSISYETFKCLLIYLINLSHNENHSIKKNINTFLKAFEDLINFYRSEKETTTRPKTILDSVEIIFIVVYKLFEKYKEIDFKLYKDCSQVGKMASFHYKHLRTLSLSNSEMKKRIEFPFVLDLMVARTISCILSEKSKILDNVKENIARICEKNILLYIELENESIQLSSKDFTNAEILFEMKLAYSFYKQTMDILNSKNLKSNEYYKCYFLSEVWFPEVIIKAIEDYYQKSEPEDFETSLKDFLKEMFPAFQLLCQDEFKELFPQSKDLTGIFKEIIKNAIGNDKRCLYTNSYSRDLEMNLTTKIIDKTYNDECTNYVSHYYLGYCILYYLPDDIKRNALFDKKERDKSIKSMTDEECKEFIEAIFKASKKYNSQEGELLAILCFDNWDSSWIKDYHKEICEIFEHYTNSMMKTESLFAYYCYLREKVSADNLNKLSNLMKLRWEVEKNFMRFLLESTTSIYGKIDFSKIKGYIEKLPTVFFLAFLKVFLFFSRQDFLSIKIRINQEKCIDVFVKTLEHFPSLKKILVNTKELYWFPTLSRHRLLNLSEAIFLLIQEYEKNIPYKRLKLVFKGYWGSVLTIEEKLRIEHCEKSSLKRIKTLEEGGFALTELVKTENSPIPQVAKYFVGKVMPEDVRKEVVTLLSLQGNQHIVALYGFITENVHIVGFLMEYCEGGSLQKLLNSSAIYGEKNIILWTTQAAAGLNFLHKNKVVHRDVKPGNLLLDKTHRILKVADVGISKQTIGIKGQLNANETGLYGTYGFIAPEVGTTEATALVDVFSLGKTIWSMFYPDCCLIEEMEEAINKGDNRNSKYHRFITVSAEICKFRTRMVDEGQKNRPPMQEVYEFFSNRLTENPLEKNYADQSTQAGTIDRKLKRRRSVENIQNDGEQERKKVKFQAKFM